MPSFFIRTNHCNLRCKFSGGNLCDTAYTSWFPDDEMNIGQMEISTVVSEYKKYSCREVVITGGEPTMYPDDLSKLCNELKKVRSDMVITLETNGTCFGEFANHIDLISISPKLKSSVPYNTEFEKMHEKARMNLSAFRMFQSMKVEGKSDIQWKFVYTRKEDIDEIRELQKLIGFEDEDVYLMPEGITREDIEIKRNEVIRECISNRFNYTDRIHILVWGNKRGV